jgi:hypothetical protein
MIVGMDVKKDRRKERRIGDGAALTVVPLPLDPEEPFSNNLGSDRLQT